MATSTRTTIKNGSTGSEVETLQMMLNEVYGSVLVVDGIFGNKTEGFVKQYQQDHGLVVDGIVGPATWNSLEERFSKD
ncbi:MAG: peptidoglycan-binding protein [Okeania sp. SIO2G4]|uniref:peptidoglycan-binding domain-containing protein n=1 Tax=unclassified Okeania TaxID=2634635 RepID=UPI0013B7D984|nr:MULTISPECIES: peptidoglycan-binding domain-containing protein [unclassified Okeania]NEP05678.1 peptidoglycan-binding protein [Okeania sp. SIO4D6]NEP71437.1 peptidoglycan-binding protein [Okeania sp. SIO2G5]NEP93442.1 peptidoglycan-binding protein [Okeania sp. SIO2F5]NEQ89740.1 peptidoglycan-binding protein [Okeania sp. SIO2G4]